MLGNVSRACREAGISRALFYRWQKRLERYGQDGMHPRRHRARPGRPVQLSPEMSMVAQGEPPGVTHMEPVRRRDRTFGIQVGSSPPLVISRA
jgi:transposase